jgi:hypothetical protein
MAATAVSARGAEDEDVAAADRLGGADTVVAQELAVHHGDAPVAAPVQALADLMAVAEIAESTAQLQGRTVGEAREAGSAGAGQHALADAVAQLLLQVLRRHAEDEHGEAGAAVGSLFCRQGSLDAGLAAAGDDGGGEAREALRGRGRPFQGIGGDQDARGRHAEGLGERVLDRDAVDDHGRAPCFTSRPRPPSSISPSAMRKLSSRIVM